MRSVPRLLGVTIAAAIAVSGCLDVPTTLESRGAGWAPEAVPPASPDDRWSELITLRGSSGEVQGFPGVADGYVAPIHVALLPDGRVLLVGYVRPDADTPDGFATYGRPPFSAVWTPPPAGVEPPAQVQLESLAVPYDRRQWTAEDIGGQSWWTSDSLFCSGHSLTSDGDVFFAGGTRTENLTDNPINPGNWWTVKGLAYSLRYDAAAGAFDRVPGEMVGRPNLWPEALRWYPSVIRLADERMLIVNGIGIAMAAPQAPADQANLTVETWDRDRGYALLSGQPADPSLPDDFPRTPWETWGGPYPHLYQLPQALPGDFDVLFLGDAGIPTLLSPTGPERWLVRRDSTRPHMDTSSGSAATAMLPIRTDGAGGYGAGTVLVAGGQCDLSDPSGRGHESTTQRRIDAYDPLANTWREPVDMGVGRHHAAMVVLPDGQLVLYGGFDDCVDNPPEALGRAQYVDPLRGFTMSLGTSRVEELRAGQVVPEVHGYHTVALLLPDGRVLVGGGRFGGLMERATIRLHSPWYVSQPRPEITSAPERISYGADFDVRFQGGALGDVVLVGLGSMTHSFDANQRHVQLVATTQGDGSARVTAPPDARVAPPGHYMLFVLDERRVPSIARIVHLGGEGTPDTVPGGDDPGPGAGDDPVQPGDVDPATPLPDEPPGDEPPADDPPPNDDDVPASDTCGNGVCDDGEWGETCGADCCDFTTACAATYLDQGALYCRRLTDSRGNETPFSWVTEGGALAWCDDGEDLCSSTWECGGEWGTCGPGGWIAGACEG